MSVTSRLLSMSLHAFSQARCLTIVPETTIDFQDAAATVSPSDHPYIKGAKGIGIIARAHISQTTYPRLVYVHFPPS